MTEAPRVFIDLDGTLTDAGPGIIASIRVGLAAVGAAPPGDLTWCVGPPLQQSFATLLGGDEARADRALAAYRAHYQASAIFDCTVYAGIPAALQAIAAAGCRLFLATAKPITYARRITAHFGLSPMLEAQFGSELDGRRSDKADLLAHALSETGDGLAVMIGDRRHDVAGAHANGLACIGALWGYGGAPELSQARADVLAASPEDLPAALVQLRIVDLPDPHLPR